ncbi:MAG: molybdate ABC transporter substrate-binding protein [Chloroflexi bacterium]|nr:molybdate ABC transporter substrate-binding protein [Chloroflexota bacterium]MYC48502.1 molybdate ABC transporter substrate-binding protein [Chloroflexota bacterium]
MLGFSLGIGLGLPLALGGCAPDVDLTVFAAASARDALADVAHRFAGQAGQRVKVAPGGSSALAQQIRHGAPADVYVSANPGWMDSLEREGLIEPSSRFDLLSNSLVLIAHGRDAEPVAIGPDLDLSGLLGQGRMAMAFVDAAPAGIYGKAALRTLGLWDSVARRLAQADNVRGALALVATGQARLGVVYGTDALADDNVTVIGTFPSRSHPPIRYPAAAVSASTHPARSGFLRFLRGPQARSAFEEHGFEFTAG